MASLTYLETQLALARLWSPGSPSAALPGLPGTVAIPREPAEVCDACHAAGLEPVRHFDQLDMLRTARIRRRGNGLYISEEGSAEICDHLRLHLTGICDHLWLHLTGDVGTSWSIGGAENRVKVDATLVPLTHSVVTLIPFASL